MAHPNPIPSSSPAFGTPLPPGPARRTAPIKAPSLLRAAVRPNVLPIILPPATLRPLAFRTFTKKHNVAITSSALQALATFIGRHCGSGWREEGLAEAVLEEVAKAWKRTTSEVIVEGDGDTLRTILRTLEGSMAGGRIAPGGSLSRQGSFHFAGDAATTTRTSDGGRGDSAASFGISRLEVADKGDDDELLLDPREWIKVIGAYDQPRLAYNTAQKHFDTATTRPTLFPPPAHKTEVFRQRYHIVHQRILRNEGFQPTTFSAARSATVHGTTAAPTAHISTITPIANLLGRDGSTHLLLGMLTVSNTGALTLSDLTGTIALDGQHARTIPETGSYFAPGMIVLVEGSYEETYGNLGSGAISTLGGSGGIGGTIGGKFIAISVGHPPCERRSTTLGGKSDDRDRLSGPAFGWTDFLGVGSQRATGANMARIAKKVLPPATAQKIVIASHLHLDIPSTFSALRTLLRAYTPDPADKHPQYPLAIILMGDFSSKAALAGVGGAGTMDYKYHFDALASVLLEFQHLVAHTSLVFVPGDNDGWSSAFSAGAATPLPQKPVSALFTTRIRKAVAEANREVWGAGRAKGKEGEAIWTSNPARLSWFGVQGDMAIIRDDMLGRLRRTAIRFGKPAGDGPREEHMPDASAIPLDDDAQMAMEMDTDTETQQKTAADAYPESSAWMSQLSPSPPHSTYDAPQPMDDSPERDDHPDLLVSRAITRTLLSQAHLSPFPLGIRPLHWDYAHVMSLYPLPSALVVADTDAPPYVVHYCGCTVMNPGSLDESEGTGRVPEGKARWLEYDVTRGVGVCRFEG